MTNTTEQRELEGIWIPRAIWLARGISLREKALLAEVSSHPTATGCRATNQELGRLLDIRDRHVRACIAALRDKGFVTVRADGQHARVIRSTGKIAHPSSRSMSHSGRPPKAHARRGRKPSQR